MEAVIAAAFSPPPSAFEMQRRQLRTAACAGHSSAGFPPLMMLRETIGHSIRAL
jgi:hypothetical protein